MIPYSINMVDANFLHPEDGRRWFFWNVM